MKYFELRSGANACLLFFILTFGSDDEIGSMKRTRAEVAEYIERFLDGSGEKWDWDDFTSIRIADPRLDRVRLEAIDVRHRFPPDSQGYCSDEGLAQLRALAESLRLDDSH